ncbi:MAG: pyridoxal phosphate-dependent aminotransferase [Pseudomonadota bacterium]
MNVSRRLSLIPPSATIAITAKAKQLRADGVDVVSFGAGEPDFDTPQFIKDAAKSALDSGDTKYMPKAGPALKEAISAKLRRENNLTIPAGQVAVTFGCKNALFNAFQALLNEGDKVLIGAPCWNSYTEMVKLAAGEPVLLPTDQETQFKLTPQQILDAADGAKVFVIGSPSNPTGVTYSPAELAALAEAVLQTDMIVFSDEIYEKLIYGPAEFVSFAALDSRLPERTITFNGPSKTFAMTGWRIGWAAGPKEIIGAMNVLASHATTNPTSFAQAGALAAYTSDKSDAIVESMRAEFELRSGHMAKRLNAIDGVRCVEPTGALYCFPDVSAHYGRTIGGVKVTDSLSFASAALEGVSVALVPGVAFGADQCVRLSFATSMEQIDRGLDRLEKLLA